MQTYRVLSAVTALAVGWSEFASAAVNLAENPVPLDVQQAPAVPQRPGGAAQQRFHPKHVLVRFRAQTGEQRQAAAHRAANGVRVLRSFGCVEGLKLVEVPEGEVDRAMAVYRADPSVAYAEPDYEVELLSVPDDPLFPKLWGLRNTGQEGGDVFCFPTGTRGMDIRAADAWNVWTGDPDFRIAVIDTGINYLHPDLAENIWTNPNEFEGDASHDGCPGLCGVDDDGDGLVDEDSQGREPGHPQYSDDLIKDDDENGWADDIHGYDTFNREGDPLDDNGHGSHVSGTIGAVGNNGIGVVGLNWRCKLVALKMFPASGSGSNISRAIEALDYCVATKIRLSNNSWGFSNYSQSLYDAIAAAGAADHLFVAAAGNRFRQSNDRLPQYPANYNLPNVISVAAINNRGEIATFSSVGRATVDLAAPGACILSTIHENDEYGDNAGTSMAAPHVTGVAALVRSLYPHLTAVQTKKRLLQTVRPLANLRDYTITGGLLDARAAVGDCNGNRIRDEVEIRNGLAVDCTRNGIPDECEPDCNQNGVADSCDIGARRSRDCDDNGVPDECEPDCNRNFVADRCEIADGSARNCNGNTLPDECEIDQESTAPGGPFFCEDDCVADCNSNGKPDSCDIAGGLSSDCTADGVPDECEVDCNENKIADSCDIENGTSADCRRNGVPDECEPDCNSNGKADTCDILDESSTDCDRNLVPDECQAELQVDCNDNGVIDICDFRAFTSHDCNSNGPLDECDIESGVSADANQNSIPDECDDRGMLLRPVSADGPYEIKGNEIILAHGGQIVTFEIRISGWDLDLDGSPRLRAYQAQIDGTSLKSGRYGELKLFRRPCAGNTDCPRTLRCLADETCSPFETAYVDDSRPDYVFYNLISFRVSNPVAAAPDFWLVGVLFTNSEVVPDTGDEKYAGTFLLEVPESAGGTFTISFREVGSVFRGMNSLPINVPSLTPVKITVIPDCNRNQVVDDEEIANGMVQDCNANLIPDECLEVEGDCNENLIPDSCDIAASVSFDCNENGVPDECDIAFEESMDCNANGIPDECVAIEGDCNENEIPDSCDITGTVSDDCNLNSLPDECDIVAGTSVDVDENGVPDECQTILRVPSEFPSLRAAIEASNSGDTILVADGIYTGEDNRALNFFGRLITLKSENGAQRCIIDCEHQARAFDFRNHESGAAVIEGFTITQGLATPINGDSGPSSGGAILCKTGNPTIRNCRIINSIAGDLGGGIFCDGASMPVIERCTIAANSALNGGAIGCTGRGAPRLVSCLITANVANELGGALFNDERGEPVLTNCTVTRNRARFGGGIFCARTLFGSQLDEGPTVRNSVLWGNTSSLSGPEIHIASGAFMQVFYSDVQRGLVGAVVQSGGELVWDESNLDIDPFFLDRNGADGMAPTWEDNDYRLFSLSYCIDAGEESAPASAQDKDLDGHARVLCSRVDMGAFEAGLGDRDCDHRVDLADFECYATCWHGPGLIGRTVECAVFDFNGDDAVDLSDFAGFQNRIRSIERCEPPCGCEPESGDP